MSKLVSIIIPTIGRESLKNTLISVQNQTYKNIEIIVTDDTPDNKAYKIVKEFNSQKIKYVKNKKYRRGPSGNKNNGLDYVRGDYFIFVDDDDIIFPKAIETLVSIAEEKKYRVVIANYIDLKTGKYTGISYGKNMECLYEDFLKGYLDGDYIVFVSSDLLEDRFNDKCWGAEVLLWWKVYKKAKKCYYLDKALGIVNREERDRVTLQIENNPEKQVLNYYYILKEFGEDLLRVNPKQYIRYLIRGIYFAKLANDKYKLTFFKKLTKNIRDIKLKTFVIIFYLICTILPKHIVKKLNTFLYKYSIVDLIKKYFRK